MAVGVQYSNSCFWMTTESSMRRSHFSKQRFDFRFAALVSDAWIEKAPDRAISIFSEGNQ